MGAVSLLEKLQNLELFDVGLHDDVCWRETFLANFFPKDFDVLAQGPALPIQSLKLALLSKPLTRPFKNITTKFPNLRYEKKGN